MQYFFSSMTCDNGTLFSLGTAPVELELRSKSNAPAIAAVHLTYTLIYFLTTVCKKLPELQLHQPSQKLHTSPGTHYCTYTLTLVLTLTRFLTQPLISDSEDGLTNESHDSSLSLWNLADTFACMHSSMGPGILSLVSAGMCTRLHATRLDDCIPIVLRKELSEYLVYLSGHFRGH